MEKQKSALKQKPGGEGVRKEGLVNWASVLGMLRKRKTGSSDVQGVGPSRSSFNKVVSNVGSTTTALAATAAGESV